MKRYFKSAEFFILALMAIIIFSFVSFATNSKVILKAENSTEGIRLEWTASEGAYYYEVYRKTGQKGEKQLLSKAQTTDFADTTAKEGKTYNYTVVTVYSDYSVGSESNSISLYRLTSVEISEAGSHRNGLYIKWRAVKNAKGYRVYRKTADNPEWLSVSKNAADELSFTDEEISPGQKYTYCVKAFMGEYESASANEKELSYISYPTVKGIENTDKGIRLNWESSDEAVYYAVFRKMGEETSYSLLALLDANYTEYEDKSATAGQLCSYYICSTDAEGNKSSYDREISLRHIKKSLITAAVNVPTGIKLYWSKSEGCQGYAIFKKTHTDGEWKLRGIIYGDSNLTAVDTKIKHKEKATYTVRAFRDSVLAAYDEDGVSLRFYTAPEKLTCKTDKEKGNVLTWSGIKGTRNYAVYRKPTDGNWKFLGFTNKNTFTDKSIKVKEKYVYGVEVYEGSILHSGTVTCKSK